MDTQSGTIALVPQVVDAVGVPVIAAGGIMDRRGVEAAHALGGAAAQVGTAYLFTPEADIHAVYRAALGRTDRSTALTNVFTGRPARGRGSSGRQVAAIRMIGITITALAPAIPSQRRFVSAWSSRPP